MNEHDIIQSDSDLDLNQTDFICDSDPEIEVISESYFDINAIDSLRKKNIKLRAKILKGKHINEALKENLSISKSTIESLDQMLVDLTNRVNSLEKTNEEITGKMLQAEADNKVLTQENKKMQGELDKITSEKNHLETQVNNFSKLKANWDIFTNKLVKDNCFLSRAVCVFFLASCSSFIYNYNQINNSS